MEEIAITGISGRFPHSDNVEQFRTNLFNGVDLVQPHTRWPTYGLPSRMGEITSWSSFDCFFFQINPKLVNEYDPKLRKLLETVYEAILDAGLQMADLSGRNVAVILALSAEVKPTKTIYSLSHSLLANTVSFLFNFKGVSYSVDTACSGSLFAIDQGVSLLRGNKAEAVIVCAAQSQFDAFQTEEFYNFGVLNIDGASKSFSSERHGYVKSEGMVAVLLQKVDDARRIYGTILNSGSNVDGYKATGIGYPSPERQTQLLEAVYEGFDRNLVSYVEAHGTGTLVGDKEESKALADFFVRQNGRKTPLKVGSVKSNAGHTETASGLVSLVKMLISITSSEIPGNLHFKMPNDIPEITNGLIEIVTKNTPFDGGLIGVNCFGFGGTNSHVIIKPYPVKNDKVVVPKNRLVVVQGRTEESVTNFINAAIKYRTNTHFLALLDLIFRKPVESFPCQGYVLLDDDENTVEVGTIEKRPEVWYCFAGVGSQWPGMGRDLMQIPAFEASIRKMANVLEPKGIDLVRIVTEGDWSTFDNLINSFTAIVAVSLGLVDVLTAIGLKPDRIIGHSLGEISCGYADGSLTLKQAILVAHARGHVTQNLTLARSLMASVGLSREACLPLLTGNVALACDNSPENVTISGPEAEMETLIGEFTRKQIFAKVVPSGNVAFHSAGMKAGKDKLLAALREIIPNGRRRSDKWLSSSVPKEAWGSDLAKHNSAEYHVNNYLNQVHFRQVLEEVPANAIVVEVSPRGLFQSILRRTLPAVPRFSLSDHQSTNNLKHLFTTLGKVFVAGGSFDLSKYYKFGTFPVAINTPTISSLVGWNYSQTWEIPQNKNAEYFGLQQKIKLDVDQYLTGHCVNGKVLYPVGGFLGLIWKNFAISIDRIFVDLPVKFTNVKFCQPVFLKNETDTILIVNICVASGYFEICSLERALICSGTIEQTSEVRVEELKGIQANEKVMTREDFYKEYDQRGFNYSGVFQSITKVGIDSKNGLIEWNKNWMPFIDGLLQVVTIFKQDTLCLPTEIAELVIDPNLIQSTNSFAYNEEKNEIKAAGVTIRGIATQAIPQLKSDAEPTFQSLEFVPFSVQKQTVDFAVRVCLGILIENVGTSPKIVILGNDNLVELFKTCVSPNVSYSPEIKLAKENNDLEADLAVLQDVNEARKINATFIFVRTTGKSQSISNYNEIQRIETDSGQFVLYKQKPKFGTHEIVLASNADFSWIGKLQTAVKQAQTKPNHRIYIVSNEPNSGLNGFWNSYRLEDNFYPLIRVVQAEKCPEPLTNWNFYQNQLDKDLTINYFERKEWGTLRLVPFDAQLKKPTLAFNPNKSYLVIGGFEDVGFQLANWLVQNGVRKLIINSPSGPKTGYQQFRLAKWRQANVDVIIDNTDPTTPPGAQHLLDISSKLDGIFNTALVRKAANFSDLTAKDYEAVVNPSYTSMSHFDKLAGNLTHFVCFSSLVASVGHAKHTNYGLASAAIDSLCQNRLQNGRNALALEWGSIGAGNADDAKVANTSDQPIRSYLECLGHLLECCKTKPILTCCVFDKTGTSDKSDERSILAQVLPVFGLKNTTGLNDETTLMSLGLDSIMAFEIQTILVDRGHNLDVNAIKEFKLGDFKCLKC